MRRHEKGCIGGIGWIAHCVTHDGAEGHGLQARAGRVWSAEEVREKDAAGLNQTCVSKDGEEGCPMTLSVEVACRQTKNSELKITCAATTDKLTHCNLANLAYFNLSAGKAPDS